MQTLARWADSPELLIPDTLLWLSPHSLHPTISDLYIHSLPRESLEVQALGGRQLSLPSRTLWIPPDGVRQ